MKTITGQVSRSAESPGWCIADPTRAIHNHGKDRTDIRFAPIFTRRSDIFNPGAARVRRCILLVEDHADTGAVFERMLEHFGYDVLLATTVSEAIGFYEHG